MNLLTTLQYKNGNGVSRCQYNIPIKLCKVGDYYDYRYTDEVLIFSPNGLDKKCVHQRRNGRTEYGIFRIDEGVPGRKYSVELEHGHIVLRFIE